MASIPAAQASTSGLTRSLTTISTSTHTTTTAGDWRQHAWEAPTRRAYRHERQRHKRSRGDPPYNNHAGAPGEVDFYHVAAHEIWNWRTACKSGTHSQSGGSARSGAQNKHTERSKARRRKYGPVLHMCRTQDACTGAVGIEMTPT